MTFTAKVQGPDGPQEFQVELNPQQTVGDARQRLAQQGFQLLDLVPQLPVPPSTTTTATTTQAISPADVGQVAGGGLGGPLGAIAARMALTERVPARAGSPELEPLARTAVRGARQAIPGEVLAGGAKIAGAAGRFLGSMARGRALPALRAAMATRDLPGAKQEVLRAMGEEAVEGSRLARQTIGQVFAESRTGPKAVQAGLKGLFDRMTDQTLKHTTWQKVFEATGINLQTTTAKEFERLVAKDPASIVQAMRLIEQETGTSLDPLLRTVRQSVLSNIASRAVRHPASSRFSKAAMGGLLDRDRLRTGLATMRKTLGEDGLRKVFGVDHVRELDRLSERLGQRRLLTEFMRPGEARTATETPTRLLPLALAFVAGQAMGGRMGEIIEIASGVNMLRDMRTLVPVLLSTKLGTRFVAAGIELQAKGAPDRLIVPVLARMVPAILREIQSLQGPPEGAMGSPGVRGAFVEGLPSP